MTTSRTRSVVFVDDLTADNSNRMKSEMYRDIFSVQILQNAANLIGRHFISQMDNDPKQTVKATHEFLMAK